MIVGVDLGGTKISVGLISRNSILKSVTIPTNASKGKSSILSALTLAIRTVWYPGVRAIGVGVAGMVKQGTVHNRTSLRALNGIPLQRMLRQQFRVPVFIGNDATCFALAAHARFPHADPLVGVTLGTGVGVGIIIDGKRFRGAHGAAGEFSQIPFGSGTLDEYGEKVLKRCMRKQKLRGTLPELTAKARAGNRNAIRAYARYGTELGKALSAVVNAIDPAVLVIGGGISVGYRFFAPAMKKELRKWVYPHVFRNLEIRQSKVENAGVIGAGILAII